MASVTVYGTVTGTLANVQTSDEQREVLNEALSPGSASTRYSRLDHRFSFTVGAGSLKELHVEGFGSESLDGDTFRCEYSLDGVNFVAVTMPLFPDLDANSDVAGALPGALSGTVTIRIVDTNHTPGTTVLDTFSVDEIWIRAVP